MIFRIKKKKKTKSKLKKNELKSPDICIVRKPTCEYNYNIRQMLTACTEFI